MLAQRDKRAGAPKTVAGASWTDRFTQDKRYAVPAVLGFLVLACLVPQALSFYQTNIIVNFMIWIVLGLGLNIVIGLAGLLDLGFVAFYAAGAYAYGLLNHYFGISFWFVLPIGMGVGALLGLILGYPVLRLRGDYLAIVTLGFGEIIRLVLENWGSFTMGPSGISQIDRPEFFTDLTIMQATDFMYYIMLALVLFTIFVVTRLKNSRIGRAWLALKEDEIACQAMGIDKHKTKLTAFALGATWAGLVGVVFAAKTTFINPMSFTLWESIIILSIVVVGGMGSIPGVILGALVLVLVPEWLREVQEYRMLVFGALMVLIMVFKPEGLIRAKRKVYTYEKAAPAGEGAEHA
jgi:branched-chain amino acid transport system permease protein